MNLEECVEPSKQLWGGRFTEQIASTLAALNRSLPIDKRLYNEDIDGSKAYAESIHQVGLITKLELDEIHGGLEIIRSEWLSGVMETLVIDSDEDIHTINERRLIEIIGDCGAKLHTGRSRNDQCATDLKLWTKKSISELAKHLLIILRTMVERSEEYIEIIFPGYTHLQRAQPVRFSHWLLSHAFALHADYTRLQNLLERIDFLPLGSGAIAGNPFEIDRIWLAQCLGFKHVSPNSMYGVSDRDFVAEFCFTSSLTSIHLSRLAEDMIIYSSKEFNFIKLSEQFSTGSSLMPQKCNPDSLELLRGISGSIFGQHAGFMMTMKGLPSTYNKDLQGDKKAMFSVYDDLISMLSVTDGVVKTFHINEEHCKRALSYDMLATDLAYFLVRKGVPFRDAHHLVGKVAALSLREGYQLNEIPLEDLQNISNQFDESVSEIWDFHKSVEQYRSIGGTSINSVRNQIDLLKDVIRKHVEFC